MTTSGDDIVDPTATDSTVPTDLSETTATSSIEGSRTTMTFADDTNPADDNNVVVPSATDATTTVDGGGPAGVGQQATTTRYDDGKGPGSSSTAPKTGDSENLVMYISALSVAVLSGAVVYGIKRKKKEQKS